MAADSQQFRAALVLLVGPRRLDRAGTVADGIGHANAIGLDDQEGHWLFCMEKSTMPILQPCCARVGGLPCCGWGFTGFRGILVKFDLFSCRHIDHDGCMAATKVRLQDDPAVCILAG